MPSASRNGNSANSKLTIKYDGIEVSADGSEARITVAQMVFSSSSGWSDSTNRGRVRGSAVTDETVFTNGTLNGGTNTWGCTETWVPLSFTGTTDVSFIGEVAGVSFYENDDNNDWFGPSMTITLPKRAYQLPLAPTGLLLRRVSDTVQQLNWGGNQNTPTADRYWQVIDLQVQTDYDTASWVALTTVWGDVVTANLATAANHRYRVRIKSRNETGSSAWTTSGWVYTTPAAPTGVSAARSGADIVLTVPATSAPLRAGFQAQVKENETGSFVDVASGSVLAGTAYTDTAQADTSAWRYQVRNVVTAVPLAAGGSDDLESGWVASNLILGVPEAPTTAVAKRKTAGDGTSVVSWTRAGTAGSTTRPYTTQEVQFQLNSDLAAAQTVSASVAGAATTVEHTTVENARYRYRVRAMNAAGASAFSAWSAWIATVPAAPTVQPAGKSGSTVVIANWLNTAAYRSDSVFGWSENAAAEFDPGLTAAAAATAQNRTVNPALTHRYRVYHRITGVPLAAGGTVDLKSAGSAWSDTVQLQAPPDAPTVAVSTTLFDAGVTALDIAITHRPVDASSITNVEVQYRVGEDLWTTRTTATSPAVTMPTTMSAALTLPAGTLINNQVYEIQARTKGADPGWSAWSTSVFVTTSGTPVATVAVPADLSVVNVAALTVTLGWSDPELEPPAAWDVAVTDGDTNPLWSTLGAPGTLSDTPFLVPDLILTDGATYIVRARGRDADGLWSAWSQSTFTVDYAEPPTAAILSLDWRPLEGAVVIEISVPDPVGAETEAIRQDLEWFDGGQWLKVETGLPVLTGGASLFVKHWTPPTAGEDVMYRVITQSAIPSAATTEPSSVRVWSDGWLYLNGGPGFRTLAKVRGRKELSSGHGLDKAFITPVGREKPLALFGDAKESAWRIGGSVAKHAWQREALGTLEEWEAISTVPGTMILRDYRGERRFVEIDGDVSIDRVEGKVSCTVREVGVDQTKVINEGPAAWSLDGDGDFDLTGLGLIADADGDFEVVG